MYINYRYINMCIRQKSQGHYVTIYFLLYYCKTLTQTSKYIPVSVFTETMVLLQVKYTAKVYQNTNNVYMQK